MWREIDNEGEFEAYCVFDDPPVDHHDMQDFYSHSSMGSWLLPNFEISGHTWIKLNDGKIELYRRFECYSETYEKWKEKISGEYKEFFDNEFDYMSS